MTPITSPPAASAASRQRAHQAQPPAAVDDADPAPRQFRPDLAGQRYDNAASAGVAEPQ
jgi:hypothetical protein